MMAEDDNSGDTSMTTWLDLTMGLERALRQQLLDYTPDTWKEDAIAVDVVKTARRVLAGAVIDEEHDKARILARVLKADGALEERYGDIAVAVRIKYRDGQVLNGVAFYEAKRRDWGSAAISALKKQQLVRMQRNVRHGHVLVFDPDDVPIRLTETIFAPWWLREYRALREASIAPVTRAIAIPLGPAVASNQLDTSLYKFGMPFSSQLVLRNLQGLDLDHDKTVIHATAAYSKRMDVPPLPLRARVVLAVGIAHGPQEPDAPDVPVDLFVPLED